MTRTFAPSTLSLAALMALGASSASMTAFAQAPPAITSFAPGDHIRNLVPQPEFTITGSNFIIGLPSPTNRPTVTLTHENGKVQFTTLGNVNFTGSTIWLPPGNNELNLLQAPLGSYSVTVMRPDGASVTLPGAFSLITQDQAAGDDIYIKHITNWGGPVNDIDVVGDLAYVANGRMLRILDISDPSTPVQVGAIDLGGVGAVRVRDGYAYVAGRSPYGFCVVDVSNPAEPAVVWAAIGTLSRRKVLLYGDYAYVHSLTGSAVTLYDISDPHNVTSLGGVSVLGTNVSELLVAGDRIYVGTRGGGMSAEALRVFDISADPLNPTLLGEVDNPSPGQGLGSTNGLAIEGDTIAWITGSATHPQLLHTVDVSDPALPTILETHDGSFQSLTDVAFSNSHIYVTDASVNGIPREWHLTGGMVVLDATVPKNLDVVSTYKPHGDLKRGLRVIDDRAFLFDEGEGLIVMDISNPAQPLRLGKYHSPSTLRRSVKAGNLLYVSDAWHGFSVLDVSNPSEPELVGTYQAEHYDDLGVDAFGIDYKDGKIYLGAGHLGLEVVDVSDPANPVLIGARRIPSFQAACSWYTGVTVNGDVVRVGSTIRVLGCDAFSSPTDMDLRNFDATNPGSIAEVGAVMLLSTGAPFRLRTLLENGNGIVFVGWDRHHRPTANSANDAAPYLVHTYTHPNLGPSGVGGDAIDVALNGDVLFTAYNKTTDNIPAVQMQDVSDPANPVDIMVIDGVDGLQSAHAVAIQNNRLYVSEHSLRVFDVVDPMAPVFLAHSISGSLGGIGPGNKNSAYLLADEPHIYHLGTPTLGASNPSPTSGLAILKVENLPEPKCAVADLNCDGVVNVSDLLMLLSAWGGCPRDNDCPADLNNDGVVDVSDLLMLLANWGQAV